MVSIGSSSMASAMQQECTTWQTAYRRAVQREQDLHEWQGRGWQQRGLRGVTDYPPSDASLARCQVAEEMCWA